MHDRGTCPSCGVTLSSGTPEGLCPKCLLHGAMTSRESTELPPGHRLSDLEVVSLLGAGGMGVVYRAVDTKLRREVAVKILPAAFAGRAEYLARFEREAQALASLNHPNIATLYALKESDGIHYLEMELIPGETLADRIASSPLPLAEALAIGRQITDALEAAHGRGVIHRDLKPSNVKITPDGTVKVLDFGLAKLIRDDVSANDSTRLPAANDTATGAIVGTLAYMSPEQARGKPIEKRADVWAFGCVMYEMLTGRRPFHGESSSDLLAAILTQDLDWNALPSVTPPPLRRLLRRCLEKEEQRRLRDMSDARLELDDALTSPGAPDDVAVAGTLPIPRARVAGSALVLAAVVAGSVWVLKPVAPSDPQPVTRFAVTLSDADRLSNTDRHAIAVSPDGSRLAYAANHQLYLLRLDQLEAQPVAGTSGTPESPLSAGRSPFFSPDGRSLGFWADGELRRVDVDGGTVLSLAETPQPWGVHWAADRILYGDGPDGIWQVPAAGGRAELLVAAGSTLGERTHGPRLLPGGRTVLFTSTTSSWNDAQIVAVRLDTGERRVVIANGADARYVSTGHLVYTQFGTLFAVPFNADTLEVVGQPVPLPEQVMTATADLTGAAQFGVSENGTLVYTPADVGAAEHNALVMTEPEGTSRVLTEGWGPFFGPRLSPDGRHIVVSTTDRLGFTLYKYDVGGGASLKLTFEAGDRWPTWTPDGAQIAFVSDRREPPGVYTMPADVSGEPELRLERRGVAGPVSWSADAGTLAFMVRDPSTGYDIWIAPSQGQPTPLLAGPFDETAPAFAPRGSTLAYVSNETGQSEVYLRYEAGTGAKVRISTNGGTAPMWSASGEELFFRNGRELLAVTVAHGPDRDVSQPRVLFDGSYPLDPFGVGSSRPTTFAADEGFVFVASGGYQPPPELHVVLNWSRELPTQTPPEQVMGGSLVLPQSGDEAQEASR